MYIFCHTILSRSFGFPGTSAEAFPPHVMHGFAFFENSQNISVRIHSRKFKNNRSGKLTGNAQTILQKIQKLPTGLKNQALTFTCAKKKWINLFAREPRVIAQKMNGPFFFI